MLLQKSLYIFITFLMFSFFFFGPDFINSKSHALWCYGLTGGLSLILASPTLFVAHSKMFKINATDQRLSKNMKHNVNFFLKSPQGVSRHSLRCFCFCLCTFEALKRQTIPDRYMNCCWWSILYTDNTIISVSLLINQPVCNMLQLRAQNVRTG